VGGYLLPNPPSVHLLSRAVSQLSLQLPSANGGASGLGGGGGEVGGGRGGGGAGGAAFPVTDTARRNPRWRSAQCRTQRLRPLCPSQRNLVVLSSSTMDCGRWRPNTSVLAYAPVKANVPSRSGSPGTCHRGKCVVWRHCSTVRTRDAFVRKRAGAQIHSLECRAVLEAAARRPEAAAA